jgi:hypothetical protein
MALLASLALLVAALPQNPATQAGAAPLLTPAEQSNVRDKLAKFLADDAASLQATDKEYDKVARARTKSKDAFDAELKKYEKKGNLTASMPDLRAIFENCLHVKAPPSGVVGNLKKLSVKDAKDEIVEYAAFLPKTYKADKTWRTVIVLPGTLGSAPGWTKGPDYFAATWDKAAATADTIFLLPQAPDNIELDPVPDYSRDGAEAEEGKRHSTLLTPMNEVMHTATVDRSRVFLDCGRGACGFGVRTATLFPDRFAGLVLRDPVAVDDIRVGSLHGMPVLLLKTAANAAAVDALKTRLEGVSKDTVTVLDATDEYPHKAATPQIEAWLTKQKRTMSPKTVVLEPNHDRFNRAFWVKIDTADSVVTTAADKKPRLEVTSDRAANRITVKAVGVERFTLSLNDDIVDLDKEFTIVVNEKAFTEKRSRSFREVWQGVQQRFDWDCLFSARVQTTVPKP